MSVSSLADGLHSRRSAGRVLLLLRIWYQLCGGRGGLAELPRNDDRVRHMADLAACVAALPPLARVVQHLKISALLIIEIGNV